MLTALSRNWWAVVLRGVLAVGLGVFAWARPDIFWASLVLVFGIYAVVDGLFAIAAAFSGDSRDRWSHLLEGVLGIVAGGIVFFYPGQAGTAIVIVIGIWAVVTGALEMVSSVRLRREIDDEWLLGFGGLLSIVLGVILVARPRFGEVTTTYVLGTYGIVFGAMLILLGLRLRRVPVESVSSHR
jgi:uncharacterized membrane protein HdeD (DUF308 family)